LDKIATVLGTEWTWTELIPYVSELIDDEDTVMFALAENLGKLISQVGGSTKAKFLLKPLEQLCAVEDAAVRAKAVESIKNILVDANLKELESEVCGMVKRLYEAEWTTSKNSAILLIPLFYSGVSATG